MKKVLSLFTAMIVCMSILQAQEKISFGLRGGVNFQNINGTDQNDDDLSNDLLTAFHAGVTIDIPIVPEFYFQSGLLYTIKGAKRSSVILGQTINATTKISYVELPLTFLFKPLLGSGHLLLGVGPYVSYGIGGTDKSEGNGASYTRDIEFKNTVSITDPIDATYIRTLDMGANILAGYEFANKLSFQLNAQLGLTNINPKNEISINDKSSFKNTGFGFSVGYRF